MRLFVAIPFDKKVKDELMALASGLKKSRTKMKLANGENLHMTMRFIGNDEPEKWIRLMNKIREPSFEVVFDKMGVFPEIGRVRVIWVGCEPVESLLNIHLPIGDEKFVPHVTLSRVYGKPDEVMNGFLNKKISIRAKVDRVLLMNSTLTPNGSYYEVVYEKNL